MPGRDDWGIPPDVDLNELAGIALLVFLFVLAALVFHGGVWLLDHFVESVGRMID